MTLNIRFMKALLASLLILLVGTYLFAGDTTEVSETLQVQESKSTTPTPEPEPTPTPEPEPTPTPVPDLSPDGIPWFVKLLVGVFAILVAILVFFKIETEGLKIKSIKLKKFGNIKTKASKESATGTDDSDSKSDDTSSTESETTEDPFNNNTEPTSEVDDTKEQTTEEESFSSDLQENVAKQSKAIREVKTDLSTLVKNVKDMTQTFMSLQKSLDEKDKEIKRLKIGYDADIYRNFLLRFTRVDKVLKEYMNEGQIDLKGLEDIHIQMEDALSECDVESFLPELGSDYKTTQGVADNPVRRDTTNEKQDSTIAEVLEVGYRRRLPDEAEEEFQIVTQAKVAVYIYKKPENN